MIFELYFGFHMHEYVLKTTERAEKRTVNSTEDYCDCDK
jgi:hypothetical protein